MKKTRKKSDLYLRLITMELIIAWALYKELEVKAS